MKNKTIALFRRIALSACRVSMICSLALCVVLVSAAAANAQLPSSYGKPLVINGQLKFASSASSTYRTTMTSGGTTRILLFEPLSDKLVKMDYITKYQDIYLALRINGNSYTMCLFHAKPKDNKGGETIRFSGSLKLSSSSPAPNKTVAEEVKKEEKKDEQKKEDGKKNEEAKKPEQIYPIIVLLQDQSGVIRFLAQTDESTLLEYQVRNLWELFIIIPDSCKKDFFELMKYYNPSAFTNEQVTLNRIYNAISKSVPMSPNIQKEYQQLIDDLSSDVYMKRVAARERIQKEGLNFSAYVKNLDLSQLDLEAQVRIIRFLEMVSFVSESDSIDDMSTLFANSIYAFIPLLELDNTQFPIIAQQRIREKLGDSFQFDKSAPADVRAAQIQELKTKLNFPKPRTIQMNEQMQKRFEELTDAIFDPSLSTFKF